jgi:hypothetical protein
MLTGNCSPTYEGARLGYYEFGCLVFVPGVSDDPSVADGQYRRAALEFMGEHASRAPIVMAARVGRTFGVFRPFQQMHLEAERGTQVWVHRLAFAWYWLLLPFAVAGVVIARRRGVPVYPLLAFVVVALASVVVTIGAVRYRAPAEIPFVLLAAVALDATISRWRHVVDPQRR